MKSWSRSHLADHEVVRTFTNAVVRDCATTAELLADLGELDARRLYVPAGYASMHAYCTGAHHMSEGTAFCAFTVCAICTSPAIALPAPK